jgi:glycosyltransferase involved in cell wall biosynthesis
MKIGIYTPVWPLKECANGIVTHYRNVIPELINAGVELHIITSNKTSDCKYGCHSVTQIEKIGYFNDKAYWLINYFQPGYYIYKKFSSEISKSVINLHEKYQLDVFVIEESFGWYNELLKMQDIKIVVRLHGPHFLVGLAGNKEPRKNDLFKITNEGKGLEKVYAITAPSSCVLNQTQEFYSVNVKRLAVIPNAVQESSNRYLWRPSNINKKLILFIGRFDRVKGGDIIIDAFRLLLEKRRDITLIFIGEDRGLEKQGNKIIYIEEYINNNLKDEDKDKLEYLGKMDKDELYAYRKEASIVVIPSRFDNYPNALLEAMAQGCPVIASNTGGIPEIITHNENGLLVSPGDAEQLAISIEYLLNNPALCKALSTNSIEYIKKRNTPERIGESMIEFYRSL